VSIDGTIPYHNCVNANVCTGIVAWFI